MSSVLADLRAFRAAALKEWRILRRYPAAFIGILFWPMILPGVYVLQANGFSGGDARALAAFAARTGTMEVAGFLYVGGAIYMWLSLVLWGPGSSLREEQMHGSLESLFLTPASRLVILFGPAPAYLVQALWMFVVIGAALVFLFHLPLNGVIALRALVAIAVGIPAFIAIGALFATAVLRFQEINGIVQVVRGGFQVLCGMTFPIVVLPDWGQIIARALPPTYVIGDVRAMLLGGATLASKTADFAILLAIAVAMTMTAAVIFHWSETWYRRSGTLGQY
jgi:ABC-2 type transport system permease protein